jgi:hypothetical protein
LKIERSEPPSMVTTVEEARKERSRWERTDTVLEKALKLVR